TRSGTGIPGEDSSIQAACTKIVPGQIFGEDNETWVAVMRHLTRARSRPPDISVLRHRAFRLTMDQAVLVLVKAER
ncbi:hypothetical protein DHEL01_v209569, partial [Diaporthe helianthi]